MNCLNTPSQFDLPPAPLRRILACFHRYVNVCFPPANIVLAAGGRGDVSKLSDLIRQLSRVSVALQFIPHLPRSLRGFPTLAGRFSVRICHFRDTHHAENKRGVGGRKQNTGNCSDWQGGTRTNWDERRNAETIKCVPYPLSETSTNKSVGGLSVLS